jgi:hypothetical protein
MIATASLGFFFSFDAPQDFLRRRQKSGRLMAARSNYSRLRSHLRAAVAMIDMKSSGLSGVRGDMCQDRELLLRRAVPPYYLDGGLPHKIVIVVTGSSGWASFSWNQE